MVSRRAFIVGSVTASAGALAGCFGQGSDRNPRKDSGGTGAASNLANLRIYFVGGTVFRRETDGRYLAAQLSGKGVTHGQHSLEHRSFMVAPRGTFTGAHPFPTGYKTAALHPDLKNPGDYEVVCLVDKHVEIVGATTPAVDFKCNKVADYSKLARTGDPTDPKRWVWAPKNGATSSSFRLAGGTLQDGDPVNRKGAAAKWRITVDGTFKQLSDVATYELSAQEITLTGLAGDYKLPKGAPLNLFIFSGPLEHRPPGKYKRVTHALLLRTVYDVKGASDDDIMPEAEYEVDPEPTVAQEHPCDLGQGQGLKVWKMVPPDTEYCLNYDDLP